MNKLKIGTMIRKLRHKHGITQMDLAQKLNVSDKAVSRWESGASYPDITHLPMLSQVFGVSVDYLLKGNPRGITVAGNILVDVLNEIDRYPEKSMLANINSISHAVGGCVPNTIIDLAKIDHRLLLSAVGKIGNDSNGRFIIEQLTKHGIDVSKIKISDTMSTSFTNVMYDVETKERTFFYNRGANAEFGMEDIDVDALDCEYFHIGYAFLLDALDAEDKDYVTKLARLLCKVSEKGIKTSIDAISSDSKEYAEKIIPVLKYCNYTIMNETESGFVASINPRNNDGSINVEKIKKILAKFIEYGVKDKAIIHCKEAGFMMNNDGTFICVPSLDLPEGYIKGNVGAGDAFAAGCIYGLYSGFSDVEILNFASCAATANLSAPDSVSGMKNSEELMEMHKQFSRRDLI